MSPTGIPKVYRASTGYYCEEPFGQWGHATRIERGMLYVRLAVPPGESHDPFITGWSAVRMCLDCAKELPREQYKDVVSQVVIKELAQMYGIPEHKVTRGA